MEDLHFNCFISRREIKWPWIWLCLDAITIRFQVLPLIFKTLHSFLVHNANDELSFGISALHKKHFNEFLHFLLILDQPFIEDLLCDGVRYHPAIWDCLESHLIWILIKFRASIHMHLLTFSKESKISEEISDKQVFSFVSSIIRCL